MAKKSHSSILQSLSSNPWLPIIFLILVSGFFRLFYINLIEFKYDEANALFVVTEFLKQPYFIQVAGVSSIGVNYFPLQFYMLAILGTITTDPIGLSFVIALINTLLIPIFYLVIKKYYGQLVSFFSALVLATSPWIILFSRKIWNPDLILILLIPAIYFFHKLVVDGQKKAILPLAALLILIFQLQLSGLFLIAATVFILWRLKTKIDTKKLFLGIAIAFIAAIPYLVYQLTSEPFCKDCRAFFGYQGAGKTFDFNNFLRPLEIISGSYFQNPLGNDYSLFVSQFPIVNILNLVFLVSMIIPLIGLYFVIKNHQYTYLAWFVFLVPLLMFITATPARMYYFIILAPFVAILYGLGTRYLLSVIPVHTGIQLTENQKNDSNILLDSRLRGNDKKQKILTTRYLLLATLTIPLLANLIFNFYFYSFIGEKKVIDGDYGPIFPVTRDYVEEQLADYESLAEYDQIKHYTYMFANTNVMHSKLGEYFAKKGDPNLAGNEFAKAIKENSQDISSMANLVYILIVTGNIDQAKQTLPQLEKLDPVNASKLNDLIRQYEEQKKAQEKEVLDSATPHSNNIVRPNEVRGELP